MSTSNTKPKTTINVLHLFPDLLNLYGDYANLSAVVKYAGECKVSVNIDRCDNISSIDLSKYHMIYVGSGTESSLDFALAALMPHKESIKEFVEKGNLLLATGSATELFGKCIDCDRGSDKALGILGYGTKRDKKRRILQDCLFESPIFDKKTLGFINRCSEFYDTDNSLFDVAFGVGYDRRSKNEGFIYKNFIATTLVGPLMIRNPHVLEYVMTKLFEISGVEPKEKASITLQKQAYDCALTQLEDRMKQK